MPNIHQSLLIGVSAEKLYDAITTSQCLAGWWTPNAEAEREVDSIARFPFGPDYYKEMKIIELKPFELVKWSCISGDAEWLGTTLSFMLLPGDKKSLLSAHPEIKGQIEQQRNDKGTLLIFHHDS